MDELDYYFWKTILMVKQLHDHGKEDLLLEGYGNDEIEGDKLYEMSIECMSRIFRETSIYYQEDREYEVYVFCDRVIDKFYETCRKYELVNGTSPENNRHRQEVENQMRYSLIFDSYCYGTYLYTDLDRKGRCRIVLVMGCEFYDYDSIPEALLSIRDALESHTLRMEQSISAARTPMVSVPTSSEIQRKEAA